MSRGVHNELTKKTRDTPKAGANPSSAHEKPRGTAAHKLIEHASGWAGDDLEEVIAIVASTRTQSRF